MIIISGENVADLLTVGPGLLRTSLGGGPANTAVAAARLGGAVSYAARFGSDAFGRAFRERLCAAGVDLSHAVEVAAPSSLALANLDANGAAHLCAPELHDRSCGWKPVESDLYGRTRSGAGGDGGANPHDIGLGSGRSATHSTASRGADWIGKCRRPRRRRCGSDWF